MAKNKTFKLPEVDAVKTKEEAHDLAVSWQLWQSEQSMSLNELIVYQDYFEKLAKKFGLVEEFVENAIIGEPSKETPGDSIDAITVIDISNVESMSVNTVATFLVANEAAARDTFAEWVTEAAGPDNEPSQKEIDQYWDAGKFEMGSGCVMVVRSS